MKLDYVLPEDLPNIELYMDQVTTFLEEQLKNTKRFEEDKIFTKTMINNYTKNHLLPPSNKKKYSRNHMILLIYIYYLKNFLSISDIKNLLDPLNEHFDDQDSKNSFYTIYNEIFKLEHDHNTAIRDSNRTRSRPKTSTTMKNMTFASSAPQDGKYVCITE